MPHPPITLIALDMDGTLLNHRLRIARRDAAALREAEAHGVQIVIATGRTPEDALRYARQARLHCHALGINGCRNLAPTGEVVSEHFFPPETAAKAQEILSALKLPHAAFHPKRIVLLGPKNKIMTRFAVWNRRFGYICGAGSAEVHAVYKLFAMIEDPRDPRLEEARVLLSAIPGVEVASSWHDNIEIMPAGVHKGAAVAELAARLGVAPAQVMAIGDQMNDAEMLSYAGVGVAMGNAVPELKSLARHVTGTNKEHGVAQAIKTHVL